MTSLPYYLLPIVQYYYCQSSATAWWITARPIVVAPLTPFKLGLSSLSVSYNTESTSLFRSFRLGARVSDAKLHLSFSLKLDRPSWPLHPEPVKPMIGRICI